MIHTKNYLDSKWVIENPEGYDIRDVERANAFIQAYEEGYSQALNPKPKLVIPKTSKSQRVQLNEGKKNKK